MSVGRAAGARLHVLRVFAGEDGSGGNPLGVFLDGGAVEASARQRIAAQLAFSETVFVDDPERGAVRIFTPSSELAFAGHPLVGAAWLLAREGTAVTALRPPAGEVAVSFEGERVWVAGHPRWAPAIDFRRLESAADVDRLDGPPHGAGFAYCWAWLDESAGLVRARSFPAELGIAEDEATGAAALALCARLERPIEVRQGRGSVLQARPLADGRVEVGGRVELEAVRAAVGGA